MNRERDAFLKEAMGFCVHEYENGHTDFSTTNLCRKCGVSIYQGFGDTSFMFEQWSGFGTLREFYGRWKGVRRQSFLIFISWKHNPESLIWADLILHVFHKDRFADILYNFLQEEENDD